MIFEEGRARRRGEARGRHDEDSCAAIATGTMGVELQGRQLQQAGSGEHLSSSIVVVVVVVSVVLICSGLLHVLARCLGRREGGAAPGESRRSSPRGSVRGQLQHLFSLHDAGVEQAVIDALPVFVYSAIRGLKDGADCAVCLCEFTPHDRLRLLPNCRHAFHVPCIDTWLLANSTCPVCRRSLVPDPLSHRHGTSSRFRADSPPGPAAEPAPPVTPGPTVSVTKSDGSERVLRVELGKVNSGRSICSDVGTCSGPRSYSMGSHEYVVNLPGLRFPTHRTTLSDGIPELASATLTPDHDTFWVQRGLETPHNLSRVRELMTPSPTSGPQPPALTPQHPGGVNLDEEDEILVMAEEEACLESSLSLRLFPEMEACPGLTPQEVAAALRKDKVWEVSVDVAAPEGGGRSAKASVWSWLRGRRLVYATASPSATDVQSRETKPTQASIQCF